jgi:uncharacterized protein DUF4430
MAVTVEISINGAQVTSVQNVPYEPGMNVQQAMEAAYAANEPLQNVLRFDARFFGSSGYELMMLDGISAQTGADGMSFFFWELLVNGAESPTGMDATTVHDGDVIAWNYTMYENAKHAGTRHEEIRKILTSG